MNADDLSADAAADPGIRRTLRMRGRYEQHNNPYTDGMLSTRALDVVGNGPQLQMTTNDEAVNSAIEEEFMAWADEIALARKLRTMVEAGDAAGEAFLMFSTNMKLESAVKLDLLLIEADQVATPDLWVVPDENRVDGIVFDKYGNPLFYHILRQHPGDTAMLVTSPLEYSSVRASEIMHWFKDRRPGQRRGIPRITSGLPIFAERRNFRASVLSAARVAAEMGAVLLESDAAANVDDDADDDAGDTLDIDRGQMTFLPKGYKANQLEPTQPGSNYAEFDNKLIDETARPLNVPSNIARGNSSEYNYSSGRLDYQTYDRSIDGDRGDIEQIVMKRTLRRWVDEATRIPGFIPIRTRFKVKRRVPHTWLWRGRGHVDPSKEANAQETRLANFTVMLEEEWAKEGKDPETQWKRLERQIKRMRSLGIEFPGAAMQSPADDGEDEPPAKPVGGNGSVNGHRMRW